MLRTRIATAIVLAIIVLSVLFAMPPVAGVGLVALMMLTRNKSPPINLPRLVNSIFRPLWSSTR